MKQYFKDYKSKMLKEEEFTKDPTTIVNVQVKNESGNLSKGLFVKRKGLNSENSEKKPEFMFNFSAVPANISVDEESVQNVSEQVSSIKITE